MSTYEYSVHMSAHINAVSLQYTHVAFVNLFY